MNLPRAKAGPRPVEQDAFAAASAALRGLRPIRNAAVRAIASRVAAAPGAAESELRAHLRRHPDDADALCVLAKLVTGRGRFKEAALLLGRCLEIAPDFVAARFRYADILFKLKEIAAAIAQLDILLDGDAGNPLFRRLKANILESAGDAERSLAITESLANENPGHPESWVSYGHSLRATGRTAESIAAYRKALDLDPAEGKAFWALADMKTVRFSGGDIAAMEAALKAPAIPEEERIQMQYALGKAHEDRGAFDRSFEYYAKANAAMRLRIPYDADNVTRLVLASEALFTADFFRERVGGGSPSADPIFVVSLPRSGSTLIEQILCSHSGIEAAGELPHIGALAKRFDSKQYPQPLAELDLKARIALGEEYLARARLHRKLARPFFVDKKPPNFFHVGLIHLILPNAKIIDARRNPGACCFSMFRQYFKKPRPRQHELGRLYRDYVELMAHFDAVLPGRIHRVIYENMVADPETEVRRLLDYLGLPFEPACLRFYETKRTVLTPSSEQVRRPISGEAVDHWRNYEPWLGPLIKSLGSALTCYPDVPPELRP